MIATFVPTMPLVGEKTLIVGGPLPGIVTSKLDVLVPVPCGVVTAIGPSVAFAGTVAWMSVAELTVKFVEGVPLKVTDVAPWKFVPVRSTVVPTGPLDGENELTVGGPGGGAEPYVCRHAEPSFENSS